MLILAKMLAKYLIIIIYALGSVHEKFGVWIKAVLRSKFPAGLGVKNGLRTFHVYYLIQCIRFGSWKDRRLNRA